jgi:MFS family permease
MKLKKAAILSLSFLTIMATDIVAPLISQISSSFPDVDPTFIKQSITLPSLLVIFFGLIAGQLVKIISKKAVLAIALVLYAVGGLAAGWSQTFTNHLIFRGVLGAGTGMISPIITSPIANFLKEKNGRTWSVIHSPHRTLAGLSLRRSRQFSGRRIGETLFSSMQ